MLSEDFPSPMTAPSMDALAIAPAMPAMVAEMMRPSLPNSAGVHFSWIATGRTLSFVETLRLKLAAASNSALSGVQVNLLSDFFSALKENGPALADALPGLLSVFHSNRRPVSLSRA